MYFGLQQSTKKNTNSEWCSNILFKWKWREFLQTCPKAQGSLELRKQLWRFLLTADSFGMFNYKVLMTQTISAIKQEWIYCDCVTFQNPRLNLMEKNKDLTFFLKIMNSTGPLDDLSARFTKMGKKVSKNWDGGKLSNHNKDTSLSWSGLFWDCEQCYFNMRSDGIMSNIWTGIT